MPQEKHLFTRCVILIASRQQEFETVEGHKTRGCGLSLTQFVRESPPIQ